jgi:4'-phosphopantetheinyl transferase EntD
MVNSRGDESSHPLRTGSPRSLAEHLVEQPSLIISAEPRMRAELTAARRAAHSLAALGRAQLTYARRRCR